MMDYDRNGGKRLLERLPVVKSLVEVETYFQLHGILAAETWNLTNQTTLLQLISPALKKFVLPLNGMPRLFRNVSETSHCNFFRAPTKVKETGRSTNRQMRSPAQLLRQEEEQASYDVLKVAICS